MKNLIQEMHLIIMGKILQTRNLDEQELNLLADTATYLANEMREARQVKVHLKKGEVLQNINGRAYIMSRSAVGGMSGHMVSENYDDVVVGQDLNKSSALGDTVRQLKSIKLWDCTAVRFVMNPLDGNLPA